MGHVFIVFFSCWTSGLAATLTGYASVLLHPAESPAEAAHLSPAHWDPLGRGN